jgi:ClpP class serine protease
MHKKTITAALILLFTATVNLYSAENPFALPPSAISASYSEGSFSSMLNPVFTDNSNYNDIAYRYLSFNGEDDANHFVSLNLFGFEFIYSRYNIIPDTEGNSVLESGVNIYSINRGFFFENTFGIGAGYSFSRSDDENFDRFSAWNIGLLFRPFEFLSLGVVFKDINADLNGNNIERSDIYSIAIRPWKDYFTFTADCIKKQNSSFSDADFSYSGEFKGYKDISLIVKYNTDKSITAGLTLPFFIRNGSGTGMVLDAYGSHNSETSDFKSAGIALNFKRKKESIKIAAGQNLITLKISDNYKSERDDSGFFEKREPTFQELVTGIEAAGSDPTVSGFIMEIDQAEFGMAQIQELRDLLKKIRSQGKKVYAILNYPGNREYYLATSADRIFYTPNSTFEISGLTLTAYFLKGLMDKAGVKFESFSAGKYKSANEMFIRKDMSKEARENLKAVLSELNEQFIAGIMEARKLSRKTIEDLFAKGFYSPEEAKKKGFIDEIMYRDEAFESLGKDIRTISFNQYMSEEEVLTAWGTVPAIAVITVTGSIVSGKGTAPSPPRQGTMTIRPQLILHSATR